MTKIKRSESIDASISVAAISTAGLTMEELGYPIFYHRGFVGLAAPAKTPAAIIASLNKQLNDVVQSQPFRQRMEALGMTVPADNTPQRLAEFMRRETERQGVLAKLSGHQPTAPQR